MSYTCPICGGGAVLVSGAVIYPHRVDLHQKPFWKCPDHDAYVGCHPGTKNPLGRLADAATRRLKLNAHAAFDPLWRNKHMTRSQAYRWLAEKLGIPAGACHMGSMSDDNLRRVVEICKEFKP